MLCCLAPQPLSPSYCHVQNATVVLINIVTVGSSGGIITIAVAVTIAVSAIAVTAVIIDFEGREGGGLVLEVHLRGGGTNRNDQVEQRNNQQK
jgi:hypothetical protein